jgi:hypothetical protein
MSFYVLDRDSEEWYKFEFEEVLDEISNPFAYKQVILNAMYAIYQCTMGKKRAENIYLLLIWNNSEK